MSVRLFADHCVPTEIVETLRRHGHDVVRLRDVMPVRAPDLRVIETAHELACVLLSLNGDFSDIVTYPPAEYRGIVAVQLHNHPEIIPQVMGQLLALLQAHPDAADYAGKLFIVEPHRIRIRQ
jgi:predicted nuclease of predicted toxin-antitoxin system